MKPGLHFHEVFSFSTSAVYLPRNPVLPNQKDSWGPYLCLLSNAITSHLLKDSTPQLSSQGQRCHISGSKGAIEKQWLLFDVLCFSLVKKWFSVMSQSWLHSKPDSTVTSITHEPSNWKAMSRNVSPWFWFTVHMIQMTEWIMTFASSKLKSAGSIFSWVFN